MHMQELCGSEYQVRYEKDLLSYKTSLYNLMSTHAINDILDRQEYDEVVRRYKKLCTLSSRIREYIFIPLKELEDLVVHRVKNIYAAALREVTRSDHTHPDYMKFEAIQLWFKMLPVWNISPQIIVLCMYCCE
jgi:hypothetical protein